MKVVTAAVAAVLVCVLVFAGVSSAQAPSEQVSAGGLHLLVSPVQHVEKTAQSSGAVEDIVAVAQCPVGTEVVGGGFSTSDAVTAPVRFSAPVDNGWRVVGRALTPVVHHVSARALCAPVVP